MVADPQTEKGYVFERQVVEAYKEASGWTDRNTVLADCLRQMGSPGFGCRLHSAGVNTKPLRKLMGVGLNQFCQQSLSHPDGLIVVGPEGNNLVMLEAKIGSLCKSDFRQLILSERLVSLVVDVLNNPESRESVFGIDQYLPHLYFYRYPGNIRLVRPIGRRPDSLGEERFIGRPFFHEINGRGDTGVVELKEEGRVSMHSWPKELANGLDGLPPLRFVVDYVNTSVGSVYSPFEMGISEMGSRSSVPIASLWR